MTRDAGETTTRTYVCEACGGTFDEPETGDEEALAEMHALWGDIPADERAVICDDCFKKFMAWFRGRQ